MTTKKQEGREAIVSSNEVSARAELLFRERYKIDSSDDVVQHPHWGTWMIAYSEGFSYAEQTYEGRTICTCDECRAIHADHARARRTEEGE